MAVAVPVFGIPSEVWISRQARGFAKFDPILLSWKQHPDAEIDDLPVRWVGGDFPQPKSVMSRALRKLGHAGAYRLTAAEKMTLSSAIAKIQPDVVLVHFGWTAIILTQVLPKNIPMILHLHGRDASALLDEPAYRDGLQKVLARIDGLVAVGQQQLERLEPLGLPKHVAVIPCGAPLSQFAKYPLPSQHISGDPEHPLRFISIGRISEEKGMRESMLAFERMLNTIPNAQLTLVGDGPLAAQLTAEVETKGLARHVRLTGHLAPDEVARELASSHVYLQHSRKHRGWIEGFGVTLTEAGATGLPLLASASGGLVDQIVEGENGYLFPEGDIDAQTDLMLKLAKDPALRTELGANARRLAARFDSAILTQNLERFVAETIDSR